MKTMLVNNIQVRSLLVLLVIGSLAFMAHGAPVLGTDNFDNGEASRAGWQSVGSGDGVDTIQVTGGVGDSGYYQLFYPSTAPGLQLGYIYNNDANHIGNYSNHLVSFSFLVMPVTEPVVAMSFYFRSGGVKWSRDFNIPSNAWTTVSIDFTGIGWSSKTGTDFMGDVANVTEIGFDVNHLNANGSAFTYGLDNFTTSIPVPEPESIALAIVACFSLVLTFRQPIFAVVRRRRGTDREI